MTSLLVGVCDGVFGVAKKHAEVMKNMPSLRLFADKIQHVTNGVRVQDWQASEFTLYQSLSDQDLLEAKRKRKRILLDWAWRHCRLWPTWAKEGINKTVVVWTRRITPYKRLDILVKLLKSHDYRERFKKLDMIIFIGGRIHQQDNHAQDIVYEMLDLLEKDSELQGRVVPVDNFNIWEAPILFQGADAAIMMADDTREASATGFMKAQMNGAAILATADGAVPEFVRFQANSELANAETPKHIDPPQFSSNGFNGFLVPYINGEPTPQGLMDALTGMNQVYHDPTRNAAMLREALNVTPQVSVARTVEDTKRIYRQVLEAPSPIAK